MSTQPVNEVDTSDTPRIITNNVPRPVIDAWDLTAEERAEFDYLNWTAIAQGEDSASFFRYKGQLHDLGEFDSTYGLGRGDTCPGWLGGWDGYRSDSFFSALVVRFTENHESVVVGLALS